MIDTPHQGTGLHNTGVVSDFDTVLNHGETTGDWRTDRTRVSDPLTARERDVLAMISQGLSNKRIARVLEISPETVKSHVKRIFLKLAVGTRSAAMFRQQRFAQATHSARRNGRGTWSIGLLPKALAPRAARSERCAILGAGSSRLRRPAFGAAMEVTLSRKRAKRRTRGRKHSTGANVRVGRSRKTRADLEQQLKACRQASAHARERLAEATMQQTATSEMLRLISNSPIQSVLDAVAEHAARLCDASNARIWRLEDNLVRLVASYGESSATMDGRDGLPLSRDTVTGRAACDRRTIHVPDIATEDSEYPLGSRIVKGEGWHTTLATPLLREGTAIGTILVRRTEVRPFTDKQIALLETFADQAAIAIESVRLFETEKQRTLALEQSEYKLRQIIETLPSLIWATTPEGEPSQLNQRVLDYSGMRFEDFLNGGWARIIHPDDLAETAKALNHAIQNGTSYETVHRLRRADGEYRWHHALGEPLRDEDGRIIQWYGVSIDIDEVKMAEERLRRSEAYLAESQRLSHTGTAVFNQTEIFFWSDETYRFFGFDPSQGIPSRDAVWQRVHPDDAGKRNEAIERAVSEKRSVSNEFRIVAPDGTVKHILGINYPVFSSNGDLVEIIGTAIDVTERKRTEDALREREAQLAEARRELRQLIDTIRTPVASYSPDNRRDFVNDAWKQYTGLSDEAALGTEWSIVTHPDHVATGDEMWRDALATGKPWHTEELIRRADGQYRWFAIDRVAARDENGKIIKWYATGYDIDDRKRAEERLRVQHTVAQVLAEAATIEEATPKILLAIGECLGWDVGVLWRVDREAAALRCVELWHRASIEVREFERASRESTFVPGVGLPGRVWSNLEPEYIPDIVLDENFPRAPIAEREGLRAAFGFPILLVGEVLGVIEFFSREIRQPDQALLNVLATIGSQIGQFIERKRAEQALREREARIRRLVDANIIGIFIWDFDGRILEANEAFLRIVGFDHEDLVAGRLRWTDLTPPEWRDRDTQLIQAHRVSGTLSPFEKEYFRKDGSRVPVLIGMATFEESGNQGVAFVIDLTERKRVEEALRRGEAWLAQAQTLTRTGTWVMNGTTRRFLYWSDEGYRIWGFDPLQGLPSREDFWGRIHPDDRERVWQEVQKAMREQRDFFAEFRILLPNGTVKYLEANTRHEFSPLGALLEVVCTSVDVTERKRAQHEHEKLRQLESDLAHMNRLSMMGELAASLAHEIAQPIATARNNARAALNFLDKRPRELSDVREAIGCVVSDADRAANIIDRIRDQVKKASPRKLQFDLNEAIDEVLVLAGSAIAKNEVSVQTRLAKGLLPVHGDRVQLQQVTLNLILNAVEAMGSVRGAPRELSINSEQSEAKGVLVAIRDTGPGIDPENRERVFEAFYTTKSSGVGMGLSICRSIINAHGGRLWADVNEPRGAVFRFILPGARES